MEYGAGAFGTAVEALIQPIVALFTLEGIGGLLTTFIVVLAIGLLAWTVLIWFLPGRTQLNRAIAAVRKASGENENASRRAFARRYGEIDAELDGLRQIGPCWREFRETLEAPDLADPDVADNEAFVRNEKRPQTYFTLANAGLSASVLRSWPGILVGTGLVLTFVGLIAALGVAANGLNDSNMDQAQMTGVLRELLSTAGAKFYASATALLCSIVLGFVQRLLLSRLAAHMRTLNDLLEERLHFDAMASTSRQQLAVLREQAAQSKLFNQDFALKVGDAVRDAFQSNNADLVRGLDAVADKLDALADKTSGHISQTVGDKLDAALSETLARMDGTLREVSDSLERLPDQIGSAVGALSSASDEMGERMRASADETAQAAGKRLDERLGGVIEALNGTVEALRDSGEAIGERSARAADVASETMSEAGRRVASDLASQGEGVAQSLRGIVDPLNEAVETLRTGSAALGTEARSLAGSVEGLRTALREGENAHRGVAETLKAAATSNAMVASDGRALVSAMTEAATRLGTTEEAVSGGSEGLRTALSTIEEQARVQREEIARGREQFLDAIRTAQADLERHAGRYDGLDTEFEKVLTRFNEAMAGQQQKLGDHVREIDDRFGRAVDALSGAIDDLSDAARERPRQAAE